ncbi:MAG: hypothetical protein QW778_05600 [Candidatus Micrarchaeaceae archaeon]
MNKQDSHSLNTKYLKKDCDSSIFKDKFNIAYVGNFLNHGNAHALYGTGLVYLISNLNDIMNVDVICPFKTNNDADLNLKKITIMETYNYKKPVTMLRIIKMLYSSKYNLIIFNMNSTSFGESNLSNFLGLISPLILKRIFKKKVIVIYHSSVITNDVEKLGYDSAYDKLRKTVLKYLESSIFKHVNTFVLLQFYKEIIDQKIKNNKVNAIKIEYLECIPTILLNQLENEDIIVSRKDKIDKPIILLYGYWGPQKDLEFALKTLYEIRKEGFKFYLVIGGGINNHFKDYKKKYDALIEKYKDIINEVKGFVEEREIVNLFTSADLLLLSYNAPGGWSGVLEQAIFFEIPVIGIEFPEYKEQAEGHDSVILVKKDNFKNAIKDFIINFKPVQSKIINVKDKLDKSVKYINGLFLKT